MNDYLTTLAVILRAMDYKEADQLLTVYTRTKGKITVLAKGIKKNASKLRGSLQLFSLTELTLVFGKTFPIVINAQYENNFAVIRSDFTRMSYASYYAELLDQLLVSDEQDETLFLLIVQTMNLLSYIDPWLATKVLEIRLLAHLGYTMELSRCQICAQPIDIRQPVHGINGGIVCPHCLTKEAMSTVLLNTESITLLKALSALPFLLMDYLAFSSEAPKQLDDYLDLQLAYILDKPLKTRRFLRNIIKSV